MHLKPVEEEGKWARNSDWEFRKTEKFHALTGYQTPDREASSLVTIHTTPLQLQKSTEVNYTADRPAFCHTDGGHTFPRNVGTTLHSVISYYGDPHVHQSEKLIYHTPNAVLYSRLQWCLSQEIGKGTCLYRTIERPLTHYGQDKCNTRGS